ncbi:MAG: hypothetical protein WA971_00550, partial [Microbacterium sp.]
IFSGTGLVAGGGVAALVVAGAIVAGTLTGAPATPVALATDESASAGAPIDATIESGVPADGATPAVAPLPEQAARPPVAMEPAEPPVESLVVEQEGGEQEVETDPSVVSDPTAAPSATAEEGRPVASSPVTPAEPKPVTPAGPRPAEPKPAEPTPADPTRPIDPSPGPAEPEPAEPGATDPVVGMPTIGSDVVCMFDRGGNPLSSITLRIPLTGLPGATVMSQLEGVDLGPVVIDESGRAEAFVRPLPSQIANHGILSFRYLTANASSVQTSTVRLDDLLFPLGQKCGFDPDTSPGEGQGEPGQGSQGDGSPGEDDGGPINGGPDGTTPGGGPSDPGRPETDPDIPDDVAEPGENASEPAVPAGEPEDSASVPGPAATAPAPTTPETAADLSHPTARPEDESVPSPEVDVPSSASVTGSSATG